MRESDYGSAVQQVRGLQAVAPMDDPKRGKRENYGLVGLAPVANGHMMVILDLIHLD